MLRVVVLITLLGSLWASGCGTVPTTDAGAGADAGAVARDGGAIAGGLTIGEGESVLRAIEEGDTLLLARGCQGSQHVWISLRADASFDPRGMTVRLDLFRARDDLRVSLEFLVRLSFQPDASETSSSLLGLTLQVPMPDIAIGEDLRLEAQITDRAGMTSSATHTVRVAWGTEVCGGMGG